MTASPSRWRRLISPCVLDHVDRWNPRAIRLDDRVETWEEAARRGDGYSSDRILEHVAAATRQVVAGEAAFERDGVAFDNIEYNWPVATCLLSVALSRGRLRVLDVGGALGSAFWQHRPLFSGIGDLSWVVVEQPHFVALGRGEFESPQLSFATLDEVTRHPVVADVLLVSSVLQYLPDPTIVGRLLEATVAEYLIIDKTPVTDGDQSLAALQLVPSSIYPASYPVWLFSRADLDGISPPPWQLDASWSCPGPRRTRKGRPLTWTGQLLTRRTGGCG